MRAFYGRPSTDSDFLSTVHRGAEGNALIREALASDRPTFVTRLSAIELATWVYREKWRGHSFLKLPYLTHQRRLMENLAGFFPVDDDSLDRFASKLAQCCAAADIMALSLHRDEHVVVNEQCPRAGLIEIDSLAPMCFENPWSSELEGKTVLVVHPFATTIEAQYANNRTRLYRNPHTLPEFQLKTLRPVQSSAGCKSGHVSWFEALDDMTDRISRCDFDVALVGAGAYGMAIGEFVKGMGRTAVHVGGFAQLLFGIKGSRWEREDWGDLIVRHYTDAWVRPAPEETPEGAHTVEDGCFW